ncbi:MAG: Wzz/FepE/Etk N-terminal domain-containing protein [Thalassotalea sp.]
MVNQHNSYNSNSSDDEIDLLELWRAIWAGKFIIILISALFAGASIFYALSQPNTYKASALLAPASSEGGAGGLAGLAGQFGGLASLAGINIGGSDKTALALEIIKSRSFLEKFIQKHDLLVPLMASKGWDINTNQLILDEEVYNPITKQWLREVQLPKKPEPSWWEAYKAFSKLLTVSQDKTSGMVTMEIEFYSPEFAQAWLTSLIQDINRFTKEQDQIEAQNSIDYLTRKLEEINVSNMETVFYQLIEEQSKNMMLTQVKAEYVLKTIDPPQVPEEKAGPKRALIVVLGTMLGGILSILIVLVRYFTAPKEQKI